MYSYSSLSSILEPLSLVFHFFQPLSLSLCLCCSLCLYRTVSLFLPLSLSLCHLLCPSISFSRSQSVSISLPLCFSSAVFSFCLSVSPCIWHTVTLSFFLSLFPSFSLPPSSASLFFRFPQISENPYLWLRLGWQIVYTYFNILWLAVLSSSFTVCLPTKKSIYMVSLTKLQSWKINNKRRKLSTLCFLI